MTGDGPFIPCIPCIEAEQASRAKSSPKVNKVLEVDVNEAHSCLGCGSTEPLLFDKCTVSESDDELLHILDEDNDSSDTDDINQTDPYRCRAKKRRDGHLFLVNVYYCKGKAQCKRAALQKMIASFKAHESD